MSSSDYKCVIDRGGRKIFYRLGVRIAKSDIPSNLLEEILSRTYDSRENIEEAELEAIRFRLLKLESRRDEMEKEIRRVKVEMADVERRLEEKLKNRGEGEKTSEQKPEVPKKKPEEPKKTNSEPDDPIRQSFKYFFSSASSSEFKYSAGGFTFSSSSSTSKGTPGPSNFRNSAPRYSHASQDQQRKPEQKPNQRPSPPPASEKRAENSGLKSLKGASLFKALGISNRKEWKKWLFENHPDRNPNFDADLVAIVNNEAGIYFGKK
nr:hypothetical protein pmam_443 [Pithovirus mammoth]